MTMLTVGLAAAHVCSRARASVRDQVLLVTFAALAVIPLASALPGLRIGTTAAPSNPSPAALDASPAATGPSAWRRFCLDAECAADDAVLRTAQSDEYAEQLVDLARGISHEQACPALDTAGRSDFSARITAMLDGGRRHGHAGLPSAGATAAAALILAVTSPLNVVAQSHRAVGLDGELYEASGAGDLGRIDRLLRNGAGGNAAIPGDGSPLIAAARHSRLAPGALLLDRGADPNRTVPRDGNPLIVSAAAGHADVVSLLLNRGARIDEVASGDESALIQASAAGRLNVVQLLVNRGANINVRVWVEYSGRAGEWWSPLRMTRRHEHRAVADFLIASGARE